MPPVTADGLDLVTYRDVAAHLGNPASLGVQSILAGDHIFALYVIGTLCTIWHFTYGLKGFCWTWGIAVGRWPSAGSPWWPGCSSPSSRWRR